MAEGDLTLYNEFKFQILNGEYDLANLADTINLMLVVDAHVLDIDNDTGYASVSGDEYGAAANYAVGGETLANQATSKDNANDRGKFDGDDVLWAALGPLADTPSYAILYDDTHASKLLILAMEIGVTAPNGGNYTVAWHVDGIILAS